MLPEKKNQAQASPAQGIEQELRVLYARRSAIDTLIRSLEAYDRFKAKGSNQSNRQSA
jgi:hypothetical protein